MASAEDEICTYDRTLCADHSQLATNTSSYKGTTYPANKHRLLAKFLVWVWQIDRKTIVGDNKVTDKTVYNVISNLF